VLEVVERERLVAQGLWLGRGVVVWGNQEKTLQWKQHLLGVVALG